MCPISSQKYSTSEAHRNVHTEVFRMSEKFVPSPLIRTSTATDQYGAHSLVHRFTRSQIMQEAIFPMGRRLLSPKYVQPVVDKYTALTYQHLEERANQYDGMKVALRDFIVPLTFDTSSCVFFGKHCPVEIGRAHV